MSVNISLYHKEQEVYFTKITNNLARMAINAGLYYCLWKPEDIKIEIAHDIIQPLEKGIILMAANKYTFDKFNSTNGYGTYKDFMYICCDYLNACKIYPYASVQTFK